MRSRYVAVFGLSLAIDAAQLPAAPPAVGPIDVARSGGDLVLTWAPVAGPVDGYRVYRADDPTCGIRTLIYDGAATTAPDVAALATPILGIYQVTSYDASGESVYSPPAYKFPLSIPPAGILAAVPYRAPAGLAHSDNEFCMDLNGGTGPGPITNAAARWNPSTHTWTWKSCEPSRVGSWPLDKPMALGLVYSAATAGPAIVWGSSDVAWVVDLPEARRPFVPEFWFAVTIPYDHGYSDLLEIANEIPNAVDVQLFINQLEVEGLHRESSTDPWTGPNLSLAGRRGEGLFIAVDSPTTWTPSQFCYGPAPVPARIGALKLTKAPGAVDLVWSTDPRATGGYDIHRLAAPTELLDPTAYPPLLSVAESSPVFPVRDIDVHPEPGRLDFYQVVGRSRSGEPGAW